MELAGAMNSLPGPSWSRNVLGQMFVFFFFLSGLKNNMLCLPWFSFQVAFIVIFSQA